MRTGCGGSRLGEMLQSLGRRWSDSLIGGVNFLTTLGFDSETDKIQNERLELAEHSCSKKIIGASGSGKKEKGLALHYIKY